MSLKIRPRKTEPQVQADPPAVLPLRAVRPNVGIQAWYKRKINDLLEKMQRSVLYWLTAAWNQNPPENMAQDASPAKTLDATVKGLVRRWMKQFDLISRPIAQEFADRSVRQTDDTTNAILKSRQLPTIEFKMTPAMNDAYQAVIAENVGLIKSIPQKYLQDVQGAVMRSVAAGRNIGDLTDELKEKYGITKRRAELISRDQNNKATAVFTRVRQKNLGATKAVWRHSHGGKEPRPSHVAMDGKVYDIEKGMWDEDERKWIFPGELINCRCTSETILPGLEYKYESELKNT